MKKKLLLYILLFFGFHFSFSQVPLVKMWDKRFGGTGQDSPNTFQQTADGGYVLGGFSYSGIGGEKTEDNRGGQDYWIIKTGAAGNIEWDKRFGGTSDDNMVSLQQTTDGGYILGGCSQSDSSGDKTQPSRGSWDYWIVKIDSAGNKQWDKRFGGAGSDKCISIIQTIDGGYLAAGFSSSDSSGDKSQRYTGGNISNADFWLVKIDSAGNKEWDKRFGSASNDYLFSVAQAPGGAYMLGGSSGGSGYDVSQTWGDLDYWIIKIDASGNKLWDKSFGGTNKEYFYSLKLTNDLGYILHGVSLSGISGNKTQAVLGNNDLWVVKLDSLGNKQWDNGYGGSVSEWGGGYPDKVGDIFQTMDGGYLFAGASSSPASGTKSENNLGLFQSWLVKTDSAGNKMWDKTIFTRGTGTVTIPIQSSDGCFLCAINSFADTGAYKTQLRLGFSDYWLVKFCTCQNVDSPTAFFTSDIQNICRTSCVQFINYSDCYDSCVWSFPGGTPSSSTDPTPVICYADTGNYPVTLIVTNANGSDTIMQNNYLQVQGLYPTITIIGDTLESSVADSYQWYDLDGYIDGETNQTFIPSTSGYYRVCVTDTLGCTTCSDSVYFSITSMENLVKNTTPVLVFPSSFSSDIRIKSSANGDVIVYDLTGKEIIRQRIERGETILNAANISRGFYLLQFSNANTSESFKLFKH